MGEQFSPGNNLFFVTKRYLPKNLNNLHSANQMQNGSCKEAEKGGEAGKGGRVLGPLVPSVIKAT